MAYIEPDYNQAYLKGKGHSTVNQVNTYYDTGKPRLPVFFCIVFCLTFLALWQSGALICEQGGIYDLLG